jgi:hypothetical protein
MESEIKLWVKAKDVVTWFTWIVTAITKFLTGCDRVQITPEVTKWEMKDSCSFDVTSLKYISAWVTKHFNKVEKKVEKKEAKHWWPNTYKCKQWY